MADPIEVLLKFAFLAVLYLFLLWVARSALKDLRRPAPYADAYRDADYGADGFAGHAPSSARIVAEHGGGLHAGQRFVVGTGLVIGRAGGIEVHIEDNFASRAARPGLRSRWAGLPRGHELDQRHLSERPPRERPGTAACR